MQSATGLGRCRVPHLGSFESHLDLLRIRVIAQARTGTTPTGIARTQRVRGRRGRMRHLLFAAHLLGPRGLSRWRNGCRPTGCGLGCGRRSRIGNEARYPVFDRPGAGCDALAHGTGAAARDVGEARTGRAHAASARCGGAGLVGRFRPAGHARRSPRGARAGANSRSRSSRRHPGPSGHRRTRTCHRSTAGHCQAGCTHRRPRRRTRSELRCTRHQTRRNARPEIPRPSIASAANMMTSAWSMEGSVPGGTVNSANRPVPMRTITASTSTLMPEDTTLPSTRSARKAVFFQSANGTSTKPASVASLNSISVTKSCTASTKKLTISTSQARPGQARPGTVR